ncbi:toll/interleukin-1 receptor domain-containing protein [Streptomyces sp. NPDC047017]|uniref:toll/interleukin-1 receptor domain-containing protein n=1 Tax=Streptomyces sp. NPDC047017 TaxID=3155024 RepID=UPI0033EC3AE6
MEDQLQGVLQRCTDDDPRVRPLPHVSRVMRAQANAPASRFSDRHPGHPAQAETNTPQTLLLSHAGVDRPWAEWIAWHLKAAGHHVVLDMAGVAARDAFARQPQSAAQAADAVIIGRPDVPGVWPLRSLLTAHLTTGHVGAAER